MRFLDHFIDIYKRKRAIAGHRKMWRWLAENPDAAKWEYVLLFNPRGAEINDCFACTYADYKFMHSAHKTFCECCPLDWDFGDCTDEGSLYDAWYHAKTPEERAETAKMIAELPERKVK